MISTKTERVAKGRALALGLFLVAAFMAAGLLLFTAEPAHASTFTVNSTRDNGDATAGDGVCDSDPLRAEIRCTLREAIQESNALPAAPHTINFNIPSSTFFNNCDAQGVCTISPASQLPTITRSTTINAYSQPGASVNTASTGTNAVLKIVLDGSKVGSSADGLVVTAPNSTLRGLVINNGFHFGVLFDGQTPGDAGRTLEGCFIGTDASGSTAKGNLSGVGIADGEGNVIGGTTLAARNLISGNGDFGVALGPAAPGNRIEGNLIGTRKDETTALGNRLAGILITGGSDNTIGGNGAARNTIAFNGTNGIQVQESFAQKLGIGNRILSNFIHSNAELGIDLVADGVTADGVTANDFRDPDSGPNTLQNFPAISSAVTFGASTTIQGGLNSTPNQSFTLQFYSSPAPDPSGFGEGKTFIGAKSLTTNSGSAVFFTFVPARAVPVGHRVTATATGVGGISEFSRARIVERPVIEQG